MKRVSHYLLPIVLISIVCLQPAEGQTIELAQVVSKPLSRTIDLPGEFQPFLSVALHAKVTSYVEKVLVDRGSSVKEGQLLVELTAPEMKAQIAEAESKLQSAQAEREQAEAQLSAAESTFQVLAEAAKTPGAIEPSDRKSSRRRASGRS